MMAAGALGAVGAWAPARRRLAFTPKAVATTGSIEAGSRRLTVASATGLAVGDSLIVAPPGGPGAMGPGGAWPGKAYATAAEMMADRSQPNGAWAWAVDSGVVYFWWDGRWQVDVRQPWFAVAAPLALLARITAIDGQDLTLDRAAAASAARAAVHVDNAPAFNALAAAETRDGLEILWPAGDFAVGTVLTVARKANARVAGEGQSRTRIFSPPGCISAGLEFNQCPGAEAADLAMVGNAALTGPWGLDLRYSGPADKPQMNNAVLFSLSDGARARDCTAVNTWIGFATRRCGGAQFHRCTVRTEGTLAYVQWMINFANSTGCASYDCRVESRWLTSGFECFASNDCRHIRPSAVNASFSLNSTGGCVIDSPTVVIGAGSQLSNLSFHHFNPIYNINQNINQNRGKTGNQVVNQTTVQKGYINADKDVLLGFNVSGGARGSACIGGRFHAPDYSGNGGRGPQAANSGPNERDTLVKDFTCVGAPNPWWGNINVQAGRVVGCRAPKIICPDSGCVRS